HARDDGWPDPRLYPSRRHGRHDRRDGRPGAGGRAESLNSQYGLQRSALSAASRNAASIAVKNIVNSMVTPVVARKSRVRRLGAAASTPAPLWPISHGVTWVRPEAR